MQATQPVKQTVNRTNSWKQRTRMSMTK